ncbi:MAG: ribosomal RNA small subunit methyltransferase A [Chloroflexi bacterium]|nr:ribosomal RNA small subunit methyltransferase A [Chloroflexota bacterium]
MRPDKSLGQNFLVDDSALRRVMDAAEITAGEAVLEIGAGLGSLTRYLAAAARQVIAVEVDDNLIPPLREVLAPFENIEIIQADILEVDPDQLLSNLQPPTSNYLVVANIPYYITSAIIRHLLEAEIKPQRLVLTVQREVAARICAGPGEMSLLALSVQVYGEPRIVARIHAGAFYPPPKVDSAVVRIDLFPEPLIPRPMIPAFFDLARAGFGQKRKTLRNSLSSGMAWPKEKTSRILENAGIDPQRRAETLSLDEWNELISQSLKI